MLNRPICHSLLTFPVQPVQACIVPSFQLQQHCSDNGRSSIVTDLLSAVARDLLANDVLTNFPHVMVDITGVTQTYVSVTTLLVGEELVLLWRYMTTYMP